MAFIRRTALESPLIAPAVFQSLRDHRVVYGLVAPSQVQGRDSDWIYTRPALLGYAAGPIGAALLPRMALRLALHGGQPHRRLGL